MYDLRLTRSYCPSTVEGEIESLSIGEALKQAATDSESRMALRQIGPDGAVERSWTFSDLYARASTLARALLARHDFGDRIAIWAPSSLEWVLMEYASALAGITIVTVNPSLQARELQFVLEQSRASAIYLVEQYRGNPIARIARTVCVNVPAIRHVIDLNDPNALYAGVDTKGSLPFINSQVPAQIQYTSGTTGFPKGAVLSHRGLYNNAKFTVDRFGVRAGDIWLNFMPMFHTGGCGLATLGCLSARATMIVAPQFDATTLAGVIESEKVTCFLGVPTMITGLLEAQQVAPRDLSSVRAIFCGGSMVSPDLVRRIKSEFNAGIQIIYGQTETSPVLTCGWNAGSDEPRDAVGQPLPHTELSIRDVSTNCVTPLGVAGEICARGYMTMIEYNDNPEATSQTLDAEGWLHTGDLGTLDERGFLRITGRVKEMIIRGGENLFPAEIENALLEHPDLAEVAVVGLPDPRYGEIVGCFMRAAGAARPSRNELVHFCRQRLSAQKTPTVWVYVDQWPLTGSGKVRKFVLRDQFEAGALNKGLAEAS